MITRRSLADTIDAYDAEIEAHQLSKRETFEAYRAQLAEEGYDKARIKVEIEATKAAIKRRRAIGKDRDAVEEKDALVDEITAEICRREPTGTDSALCVARGALPATHHDSDGVVIEPATTEQHTASTDAAGLTPTSAPASGDDPGLSSRAPRTRGAGEGDRPMRAALPNPIPVQSHIIREPAAAAVSTTPKPQSSAPDRVDDACESTTPAAALIHDLTDAEWITHPDAAPLREAGATAFRNGVSFRACPHGDPLTPPLSAAVNGWTVGWWIEQGASAAAQGRGTDACRSSAGTLARLAWMAGWERGQIAEAAE